MGGWSLGDRWEEEADDTQSLSALESNYAQLKESRLIEDWLDADVADLSPSHAASLPNLSRSDVSLPTPSDYGSSSSVGMRHVSLRQWLRHMEERLQHCRPDQLDALRREIEGHAFYFKHLRGRGASAEELELRYHQLLLRVMEHRFMKRHVHISPEPDDSPEQLLQRPPTADQQQQQPEQHPPELPPEAYPLLEWLQRSEEWLPPLTLHPSWTGVDLQRWRIQFRMLQTEVERRSVAIGKFAHNCQPHFAKAARDLKSRCHGLLLRLIEWNLHLESLDIPARYNLCADQDDDDDDDDDRPSATSTPLASTRLVPPTVRSPPRFNSSVVAGSTTEKTLALYFSKQRRSRVTKKGRKDDLLGKSLLKFRSLTTRLFFGRDTSIRRCFWREKLEKKRNSTNSSWKDKMKKPRG